MLLSTICRQFCRGINVRTRLSYNLSALNLQQVHLSTSSVCLFHHRISGVQESTNKKLRRQYRLSDDYVVVYKEPKQELSAMVYIRCMELFLYCSPLITAGWLYLHGESIVEFTKQDDFWIGILIVSVYLLGIRFVSSGYVNCIFYNSKTDTYRAYVFKKLTCTYKFIEFKSQDLKVMNLPPSVPLSRNIFKLGKQHFVLHDKLFASLNDQDRLTSEAIEKWLAQWEK